MFITVDVESGQLALEEPEVLTQFHVTASGGDLDAVIAALGAHGRAADVDDHVLVAIDSVRAWAAGRVDDGWEQGFAKMLDFARSKGWLDDAEDHIQAHVEWV